MSRVGTTKRDGVTGDPEDARATVSIVVADDHAVVRAGLRMLLDAESDFAVVAEAGDAAAAVRSVRVHRPSVLVLDLNMPGDSSLGAIPGLRATAPHTGVVVLTMQDDPAFAREALQAGALAYVLKEAAGDELVTAVRMAAAGRAYLNPQLGRPARRRAGARPGPAGRPERARGRDPAPHRARPHEHRDRRPAVPQRPHRRVPPRAHPAEAAPLQPLGARALRDRARLRSRLN